MTDNLAALRRNSETAIRQLVLQRETLLSVIEQAKVDVKKTDAALSEIIRPEAVLLAAGKEHGQTTLETDGVKITVKADKKVKWDSAKLMEIATKLPWEQVRNLFKITFEMPETKYGFLAENVKAGMQPAELLQDIDEARTVEIGEAKISAVELLPLT